MVFEGEISRVFQFLLMTRAKFSLHFTYNLEVHMYTLETAPPSLLQFWFENRYIEDIHCSATTTTLASLIISCLHWRMHIFEKCSTVLKQNGVLKFVSIKVSFEELFIEYLR